MVLTEKQTRPYLFTTEHPLSVLARSNKLCRERNLAKARPFVAKRTSEAIIKHAKRYRLLTKFARIRAQLKQERERLNSRRVAIQTIIDTTSAIPIDQPGEPPREYTMGNYGHPLPFATKAEASVETNYTKFVLYELDGYRSNPECWKKPGAWNRIGPHRYYPLPYTRYHGRRRHYVAKPQYSVKLDISQELDLDEETTRRYCN